MISRHLLRRCYPAMVRSSSAVGGEPIRKFEQELTAKIKLNGPMSVAHYMQEALTNPVKGYYTTKDKVLGSHGDFVTSPEISQMFGECIGIWLIHEWRKMGSARPFQLVELGPGHGTLMQDILRTIMKLVPNELANLSVHLVETSQTMRKVQQARLCGYYQQKPESGDDDSSDHQAISKQGPTVKWYSRVNDVPKDFTFFIANEFFDALPIHKFVKDAGCWQEILVDIDQSVSEPTAVYIS
jgi:NADH dehydrogenase [ubiquinone] 1 alpha subcomplex assembly factor 7